MRLRLFSSTLRARLIAATILVQLLMLALLAFGTARILHEQLLDQARVRSQELGVLLNAGLAGPLLDKNYAGIEDILQAIRSDKGLSYLTLYNTNGDPVAFVGRPNTTYGDEHDRDLAHVGADKVYDTMLPITLDGTQVGELHYGLSLHFLAQARDKALWQSLLIAGLAMLASVLILVALGIGLTRRLSHLTAAAEAVSLGQYSVRLPDGHRDEVGRLMGVFNRMAESLQEREAELRESQNHLLYLAERDSLTGLFNRHYFRQELERRLDESGRQGVQGALLLFDLDEFKLVNDTFGHQVGDELLIRVAHAVNALVRRNEVFCRLGGDEFVLLLPLATEPETNALAERILAALTSLDFEVRGQPLRLSGSVGIALYPQHSTDPEALMAHADAAMYQAKRAGKNTSRVYLPELDKAYSMVAHLGWNERIDRALAHDLLRLHFQGVYRTEDSRICHLEALVRMVDEENPQTLVPPGQFIPQAEKSGKILLIDRWIVARCIRLLQEKPQMPPVAVNISGRSFDDPSLPDYIIGLLNKHQVDPARLLVEITETSAVSDMVDAQRFIDALRVAGCGVCLDDFGSGFASFAYLKHLAVDTVKIDGMFIRNLPQDHDNQVFVRGMLEVARGLGKTTVAECVEDQETLDLLRRMGVDKVQGYYLDMPQGDHPALA